MATKGTANDSGQQLDGMSGLEIHKSLNDDIDLISFIKPVIIAFWPVRRTERIGVRGLIFDFDERAEAVA